MGFLLVGIFWYVFTSFGDDGVTDWTYSQRYDEADNAYLRELPQIEQPIIEVEQPAVVEEPVSAHSLLWQEAKAHSERSRR
jgi:hypothetical protein